MKILFSPNFDQKKRPYKSIKFIVIHYTGMQSERESIKRLCDPNSKVSSHYLINANGKIYRLVKDNQIAWHAGNSCWGKYKNLNKDSIGIELTNKGHEFGYSNFKKKQLISLTNICKFLIKKYKIKKKNILGHSDIAPTRKVDPGEKFPWKNFAKKNIGIWHQCKPGLLKKLRKAKIIKKEDKINFVRNLKKIGYCISPNKSSLLKKTIRAFQMRFRKELINGVVDEECLIIAQNIAKNL